jgi:uncharacterized protein (TIGR00645 family)
MERIIETVLYHSRWLLAPMYFGLAIVLGILTYSFGKEVLHIALHINEYNETDIILVTLSLIDLALVGALVVMVIISGYENFVSRFDVAEDTDKLAWVGKLDAGGLKLKLASSIVAISSIHLLKAFMNVEAMSDQKLIWLVVIHMTFVVSTLLMAIVERYLSHD